MGGCLYGHSPAESDKIRLYEERGIKTRMKPGLVPFSWGGEVVMIKKHNTGSYAV
jgi:hypothetical protein